MCDSASFTRIDSMSMDKGLFTKAHAIYQWLHQLIKKSNPPPASIKPIDPQEGVGFISLSSK